MRSFAVVVGIIGLGSPTGRSSTCPGFPALRGGFVDGLTASTVNWQGFLMSEAKRLMGPPKTFYWIKRESD